MNIYLYVNETGAHTACMLNLHFLIMNVDHFCLLYISETTLKFCFGFCSYEEYFTHWDKVHGKKSNKCTG